MSTSIATALFGKTQRAVLGLLFGQPERSFYLRELVVAAASGASQVQRELNVLTEAGLIVRTPRGNQVWFQANAASPVFAELRSLITKTSGVADVVREALLPFSRRIRTAFIYGSVARGEADAHSDIDLMVVGSLAPSALAPVQLSLAERLGRRLQAVVYAADDFNEQVAAGEPFLAAMLKQPKLWLVGQEADLPLHSAPANDTRTRQPRRPAATQGRAGKRR
jgi:predicted nucleotidyltransferase